VSEAAAAVARVWPGREPVVDVLGGGITNHNLKVQLDEGTYVLRVAGRDTGLLGIDRRVEREATEAAAELGVGPEVVGFVEPEGWLVTTFIEGRTPSIAQMGEPAMLRRVAETLRTVHSGPAIRGRFDAFRVVEEYLTTARNRGAREPIRYGWAHELAARIERTRARPSLCLCHNDLLNGNFLDDGEQLRIVDWEYAGMGDPFFDLANFSINHELAPAQREILLAAYAGSVRDEDVRALELMRFMSDFREAMWGVVQTVVSELDFDFPGYAEEHFARLGRTADEPEFRRALGR
jgi:thiamine kinase-like enzyme